MIRSVAATPAYAQTQTSPGANHSACVAACNAAVNQSNVLGCKLHPSCEDLCDLLCPNPTDLGGLEGRPCTNCAGAADPNTFFVDDDCSIEACGFRVEGEFAQA